MRGLLALLPSVCTVCTAHEWLDDVGADLSCVASSVDHSKIVVAAVGDSITVGATCRDWAGGFVKILSDVLEAAHPGKYDVRDCGLCGHDAVRKGHGNAKHATYWDTPAMQNSLSMKPDVVIYMLGTNDADEWYNTSSYFGQDWSDLAGAYVSLPNKPKVVSMVPPPFGNTTCVGGAGSAANPTCLAPFDKNCVINCLLPKLVPQLGSKIGLGAPLDMLSLFDGPDNTNKTLMPGLHPDCAGYTVMGEFIAKQLFE
jgi:lysophospholipase L1-like esterase